MRVSALFISSACLLLTPIMAVSGLAQNPVSRLRTVAADSIRQWLDGGKGNVEVEIKVDGLLSLTTGDLQYVEIRAWQFSTPGLPLFTEPDPKARSGRIGRLILRLSDFHLNGLRVEELTAVMHNARYNFGIAMREGVIQLLESGQGPGEVSVLFRDLEPFLTKRIEQIQSMRISSEDGKVRLTGSLMVDGTQQDYEILTGIGFADGTKIRLVNPTLTLDGKPAEPELERQLFKEFETVLDLDADLNLYGCLQIESIEIQADRFRVRGTASIPEYQAENK